MTPSPNDTGGGVYAALLHFGYNNMIIIADVSEFVRACEHSLWPEFNSYKNTRIRYRTWCQWALDRIVKECYILPFHSKVRENHPIFHRFETHFRLNEADMVRLFKIGLDPKCLDLLNMDFTYTSTLRFNHYILEQFNHNEVHENV